MARSPYGFVTTQIEPRSSYRHQISFLGSVRRWRGPTYIYLIVFGVMNVFWYSLLSWCLSSGACYSTGNTMMVSKDVSVKVAKEWYMEQPRRTEAVDDIAATLKSIAPSNATVTSATTVTTATTAAAETTETTTSASTSATTSDATMVTSEVTTEATKETTNPTEVVTTAAPSDTNSSHSNNTGVNKTVEPGEMCKTVCPPITWGQWSICSKHCGGGRRFRHATYQFVCTNSELCPPNKVEEEACNTNECVVKDDYGPIIPYPNNPLNPAIHLERSANFSCGTWVSEYAQLHNEILTGKKPPKYLIYSTGKSGGYPPAGGLADRLRGITTLFYLAVATDRAFLIEWLDPEGLQNYFVPKTFDWSNLNAIKDLPRNKSRIHDIGSWKACSKEGKSGSWYIQTDFHKLFTEPVEVVQGHRYDFTYALLRNDFLMDRYYELGLDKMRCFLCCAYDILFQRSSKFDEWYRSMLSTLDVPNKPLLTIQLRSVGADTDKNVEQAKNYLKCAKKAIVDKDLGSNTTIALAFNSKVAYHVIFNAMRAAVTRINIVPVIEKTTHLHLGNLPPEIGTDIMQGVQEVAFRDLFLMTNASVIVRNKGHLAAFGTVGDALRSFYATEKPITYLVSEDSCTLYNKPDFIE